MITDLRLQKFRSYNDASFELNKGVNIIVGPNASGKTNLLEAVLVLCRGSSYRAKDPELIKFGSSWARLDADLAEGGRRSIKLMTEPLPSKSYELDGRIFQRLTMTHSLPVVLFEPNHLQLLSGSPERRRDYLDDLLEQTITGYGSTRRQYRRALAQRNNLLKRQHSAQAQVFPWDVRLSQLAGQIVRAREQLAKSVNKDFGKLYREISQSTAKLNIEYDNRWPVDNYESQMLKSLEANFNDDRARGFTSAGPHREDLLVSLNARPAQASASRGEIRTAVLALKTIELKIIEAARQTTPLLLLDDVFSELDGRRRHALTDFLAPYQTFITTTDADLVIKHFTKTTNVIALG